MSSPSARVYRPIRSLVVNLRKRSSLEVREFRTVQAKNATNKATLMPDVMAPEAYQNDRQGVVTYMSRVEAFATGIKIESSDQSPFGGPIKDRDDLRTAKNQLSRTHGCNVTFDPWKSSDQAHLLPIKKLDRGRKTLLQATCDYPLIAAMCVSSILPIHNARV